MLWLCVAVRVVANPLSNLFQKLLTQKGATPILVVAVTHGLLTLATPPLFLVEPPPADIVFWFNITGCAVLAVAGNAVLVQAMRMSDLSVLGPVNAYKSVVSILPGLLLLNEMPSAATLAGVALLVVGSYFLVDQQGRVPGGNAFLQFFKDRGVQYRLAALVLSAIEAVFLKRALLAAGPTATFAVWCALGFVVSLPIALLFARQGPAAETRIPRQTWLTYLMLAVTTGLMQFTTIVTFTAFQVAAALALFQTSTLVSVLLGWRVFRESNIAKRFVGSLIMVAGAILIVLNR